MVMADLLIVFIALDISPPLLGVCVVVLMLLLIPTLIDTHLEVWTFDPKFPFHHPERPDLKRTPVEGPIENEVAEMREFGLRYAVLINPRFYGWDNSYISYSLHRYPKLFVAHGLLNPADPDPAGRLRYL